MLSAKLRGWGSYFSRKLDDTFSSLIPNPPQSNQQETVQLEPNPPQSNQQETVQLEADPQEEARRRGQQLAENCTRPLLRQSYLYLVFVIIIWVVVIIVILVNKHGRT